MKTIFKNEYTEVKITREIEEQIKDLLIFLNPAAMRFEVKHKMDVPSILLRYALRSIREIEEDEKRGELDKKYRHQAILLLDYISQDTKRLFEEHILNKGKELV